MKGKEKKRRKKERMKERKKEEKGRKKTRGHGRPGGRSKAARPGVTRPEAGAGHDLGGRGWHGQWEEAWRWRLW